MYKVQGILTFGREKITSTCLLTFDENLAFSLVMLIGNTRQNCCKFFPKGDMRNQFMGGSAGHWAKPDTADAMCAAGSKYEKSCIGLQELA